MVKFCRRSEGTKSARFWTNLQTVSTNNHRSDYSHVRVQRTVSSSRYMMVAVGRTAEALSAQAPLPRGESGREPALDIRPPVKINSPAVICFGRWRFLAAPWHAIKQPTVREESISVGRDREKGARSAVSRHFSRAECRAIANFLVFTFLSVLHRP